MKVFLIDSLHKKVTEIKIKDENNLKEFQDLVGGRIEVGAYLPNGDVVYVNEEGLYGQLLTFFSVGKSFPLTGKGIVVGTGSEGDSKTPISTLEEVINSVKFLSHEQAVALANELEKEY
jgi:Domain of unknown function (DUF3846)